MSEIQLRCPSCKKVFGIDAPDRRDGRAQCPHCSTVAAIPPKWAESSDTEANELPPTHVRSDGEPMGYSARITVDAMLPPSVASAEKRRSAGNELIPPPIANEEKADAPDITLRAQTLASETQSHRRFRKNVIVWIICTLILCATVFLLVNLTG